MEHFMPINELNCVNIEVRFFSLFANSVFQAAGISQTIDSRLVKKIESLVKDGVKNVSEM